MRSPRLGENRVCMVTGASSGIGRATARALATEGARVVLVCRDAERGAGVLAELTALPGAPEPLLLLADLRSQAEVRALVLAFQQTGLPLHALINNAAVMVRARELTQDAVETTFAVNYLSHFLLTLSLLDTLRASGAARIVNVASDVVRQFARLDLDDLDGCARYSMLGAYKQSKLALVMFTFELARRLGDAPVAVNCLHPGNVHTNMTLRGPLIDLVRPFLPSNSAEDAARACLRLALDPELAGVCGRYFEHGVARSCGRRAEDPAAARALWQRSLQLTRLANGSVWS